jgi:hypothetical protein
MAPRRATKEEYIAIKLAQLADVLRREEYMSAWWQTVFAMTGGSANTEWPQSPPEPTTTPEDTLREAGVSRRRQARYQRRMSSLLAGREGVNG